MDVVEYLDEVNSVTREYERLDDVDMLDRLYWSMYAVSVQLDFQVVQYTDSEVLHEDYDTG